MLKWLFISSGIVAGIGKVLRKHPAPPLESNVGRVLAYEGFKRRSLKFQPQMRLFGDSYDFKRYGLTNDIYETYLHTKFFFSVFSYFATPFSQ